MSALVEVFATVSRVATPLGLAGVALLVFLIALQAVLRLNVFKSISGTATALIIRKVIDRFFVVALVAVVIALIGPIITQWLINRGPDLVREKAEAENLAGRVLGLVYERKNDVNLFNMSLETTKQMNGSFANFESQMKAMMAQFQNSPVYRRNLSFEVNDTTAAGIYAAETDSGGLWREWVQLTKAGGEWRISQLYITPAAWPTNNVARMLASASLDIYVEQLTRNEVDDYNQAESLDGYIPAVGWSVVADASPTVKHPGVCDVSLRSRVPGIAVVMSSVEGGCNLSGGTSLRIFGRVSRSTKNVVEISEVRFFPNA